VRRLGEKRNETPRHQDTKGREERGERKGEKPGEEVEGRR
jgi:hypothetical protein